MSLKVELSANLETYVEKGEAERRKDSKIPSHKVRTPNSRPTLSSLPSWRVMVVRSVLGSSLPSTPPSFLLSCSHSLILKSGKNRRRQQAEEEDGRKVKLG